MSLEDRPPILQPASRVFGSEQFVLTDKGEWASVVADGRNLCFQKLRLAIRLRSLSATVAKAE